MEEKFQKLTDREHMLLRPGMYIGGTNPEEITRFVYEKRKTITVSSGLLKIINELIDNSIDEYIRAGYPSRSKITVTMDKNSVTVSDNGRGIPIEKYNNFWRPEVAWTEAKAGTSFAANRVGPGANGVGSVVANVFSKKFVGTTCDGKHTCQVTCSNNMEHISTVVSNKHSATGTTVYIEPDFEQFGISEFSQDYYDMVDGRLTVLAVTYPNMKFFFNGEQKSGNIKDYFSKYGNDPFIFEGKNFICGILPSETDEYIQRSVIDGLDLVEGGTHETVITHELTYALRDLIKKKYKLDLSPLEIKRGLKLILIGHDFPNMEFKSQTKERLTNSEKTVKAWLGDIDFLKIAKKLVKTDSIIQPIIQSKLAKQMAAENRAVTLALKKQAKKHIDKHIEAKAKNPEDKVLLLCEGDSAIGNLLKVRDPNKHGGFPLRGMPMNTYNATEKEMLDNREISSIMAILGLKFGLKGQALTDNLQYGKIGLFADADVDGLCGIVPMLINFFSHWLDLFSQHRVFIVQSPRYVLTKGKGASRKVVYFYNTEDFEKKRAQYKDYEVRYIKGLATLRDYEYQEAITNTDNWIEVKIDDPNCLKIMYSDDVSLRKNLMSI